MPDQPKLDRRVVRTRKQLSQALIALILERGYDDLTVTDITDRADLRRATFYLHYRDKEELLFATLGTTFDELVAAMAHVHQSDAIAGKTTVEPYRVVFDHVDANSALYRIILTGHGGAAVSRRIRDYLAGLVLATLARLPKGAVTVPPEALAQFIAGAELALVTWWLENDKPHSAAQMAEIAHRLVLDGARGALPVVL